MFKKSLIVISVLLLATMMTAQQRTGNIMGRVVDSDGNPLPGVAVTLTGSFTAPQSSTSSAEGVFRFLSLTPARDYSLRAELSGFKTKIEEGIVVAVAVNTAVTLTMDMGVIEEQVTVTAVSPMVDTKKTTVGRNVDQEQLQSLPTARDPWVVLQMAPSIVVDRENIGGNESGQQSSAFAKGAVNYNNNVWALDGVVITDPSAIGASPAYYDFDAFEEMQISVGGSDATVQTGGVALNMVTRRGGNRLTLGGRLYFTDSEFQSENLTDDLKAEGVKATNKVVNIKDYGFNVGGPIIRDRLWALFTFGSQDIKTFNLVPMKDDSLLTNFTLKINAQPVARNRFEALAFFGNKEKWGRDSSVEFPAGRYQSGRYHFGSPIYKLQDEHMFGDNLFVSLKYAWSNAGFALTPMDDLDFVKMTTYDHTKKVYTQSYAQYYADRPTHQVNFHTDYYVDRFLGFSHDFKVGAEFRDSVAEHWSNYAGGLFLYTNWSTAAADTNGDGKPDIVPNLNRFYFQRQSHDYSRIRNYSGFISDTLTAGRLTFILSVRYDEQQGWILPHDVPAADDNPAWTNNVSAETKTKLSALMPAQTFEGSKLDWAFKVLSPRIGVIFDIFGDGKTTAKLNFAKYGNYLGTGWAASYGRPLGASGSMNFYWRDNGNKIVEWNELYWVNLTGNYAFYPVFNEDGSWGEYWYYGGAAGTYWSGFDPANPLKKTQQYYIDGNYNSPQTWEALLTLEREIFTDFAVSVGASYRRYTDFETTRWYYPATDTYLTADDYEQAGTIPSTAGTNSTLDASGKPYYLLKSGIAYTDQRYLMNRPDYYTQHIGVDLTFNKRLSNKWMLYGTATYQTQSQHFGANGYGDGWDLTNGWIFDGGLYAPWAGAASGKPSQYNFSTWMFKLSGMYQLPLDINVSFVFNTREGFPVGRYFTMQNTAWPNSNNRTVTVWMEDFGKYKLPIYYNLDLRIEKLIKAGDYGRIYFMIDGMNMLNSNTVIRRYQNELGTYNISTGAFTAYALNNRAAEIQNPRIFRLGIRFTF